MAKVITMIRIHSYDDDDDDDNDSHEEDDDGYDN